MSSANSESFTSSERIFKNKCIRDFPGGPVVRTLHFHCQDLGLLPGWGTRIPHASKYDQKKKVSNKMESETAAMNFLYSLDLVLMDDFIIGNLENTGPLNYELFQMLIHFITLY